MFALLTSLSGARGEDPLARIALRLGPDARTWRDPRGRGGAVAAKPDLLPEDRFDAQPLVEDDMVFACRARLDDREEIADLLGISKGQAAEMADSGLLLEAYRRWGRDCVHRLAGDFVFAAWHFAENRLFAAVDHWGGSASLFWARVGPGLAIADNLALLLEHRAISLEPDTEALANFLRSGIDRSSTPYAQVRAVTGGRMLEWTGGDPTLSAWWRPETEPEWRRDEGEYAEEARALLSRAVAARLRSTGEIASTLSGGLDSGLVSAVAARALASRDRKLLAFTSVPEPGLGRRERAGWVSDDSHDAGLTASLHSNIDHVRLVPGPRSVIDLLPALVAGAATPVRGGANLLWLDAIATAARAAGARVLLTGQHGNATVSFGGEGALRELAIHHRWSQSWALMRTPPTGGGAKLRTALSELLGPPLREASRRIGLAAPADLPASRLVHPELRRRAGRVGGLFTAPPATRARWIIFVTTPPHAWRCDPLAQWDLDWRDPTADRRLMEAVLRFPLAAFQTGGVRRGLARSLGRDLLPDAVRLRRSRGEQAPEQAALMRRSEPQYRAAVERMTESPLAASILDVPAMRRILADIAAGRNDMAGAAALAHVLTLGIFLTRLETKR